MMTFLIILFVVIVIGCIVKSILKEDDDEKQTTPVYSHIPGGNKYLCDIQIIKINVYNFMFHFTFYLLTY